MGSIDSEGVVELEHAAGEKPTKPSARRQTHTAARVDSNGAVILEYGMGERTSPPDEDYADDLDFSGQSEDEHTGSSLPSSVLFGSAATHAFSDVDDDARNGGSEGDPLKPPPPKQT